MNIYRSLSPKAISLKCDDNTLKEIIKKVIENNMAGPFPVSNLKYPLTEILRNEDQFADYEKHTYEPTLTPGDLLKISKILNELILNGYLGINFFDRHYSGSDIELFKL